MPAVQCVSVRACVRRGNRGVVVGLEAHAPVSAGSARLSTLHVHVSLSYAVLLHWVFAEVIVDGRSLFFLCPEPSLLPCSADALDAAGPAKKKARRKRSRANLPCRAVRL